MYFVANISSWLNGYKLWLGVWVNRVSIPATGRYCLAKLMSSDRTKQMSADDYRLYIYIVMHAEHIHIQTCSTHIPHSLTHIHTHINIYIHKSKTGHRSRGRPFSIATIPRCREGTTPFPGLLHFTLDPYLIMLGVQQGGIKYHF